MIELAGMGFEKERVRLHGDPSQSLHMRQEVTGAGEEGRPGGVGAS